METKGITCKIPLDLHNRISEDIRESESTMSKFIEMVINEHYMKGANGMSKMRTMAFQVSEEFFQRIKDYLMRYEQTYGKKRNRMTTVRPQRMPKKLRTKNFPTRRNDLKQAKNPKKSLSRRKNRKLLSKRNAAPADRSEKHGRQGLFCLSA